MSKGKKRNVIPNIVLCNKLTEACGPCSHGEPHQHKGNEDCGPSPCLYMGQKSVKCVQVKEEVKP